jgi:RHS repeat-associated protein
VSPGTVAKLRYDAFGNIVGASGTWAGNEAHGGGFGYQTDSTGLQLLGHRWYDPLTGRFISKDPIGSGDNWYAYCDNNPLGSADPQGLQVSLFIARAQLNGHFVRQTLNDFYQPVASRNVRVPMNQPPGSNLRRDLFLVDSAPKGFDYLVMAGRYRPDGEWDFKMIDGKYQAWGNFHYGAMMAMMGHSLDDAYYWAGVAEYYDGGIRSSNNSPSTGFPYGEDLGSLKDVKHGWWYYHRFIAKTVKPIIAYPRRGQ